MERKDSALWGTGEELGDSAKCDNNAPLLAPVTVNKFPNVPRELIRQVRAMLFAWQRHGLDGASDHFRTLYDRRDRRPGDTPSFKKVLKGKIEFIGMIRGRQDPIYCKLRQKLHQQDPALIGPAPTPLPRLDARLRGYGTDPGWTRWYQLLAGSVFQLDITDRHGDRHSGTAFALRRGCVATAAHNLRGVVSVIGPTGRTVVSHAVVPDDMAIDCALAIYEHSAPLVSTDNRLPHPREDVAVVGYAKMPLRQPALGIYAGSVEAIATDFLGAVTYIQISVASAGGLSGSPVIDTRGRVIGVVAQSTFERVATGVPGREFFTVLPVEHVGRLSPSGPAMAIPLTPT